MKKRLAGALAVLLCAAAPLPAQENLLRNAGFESDTLRQLSFWQTDSFKNTDEARRVFTVDNPARSGKRSLAIVNLAPNDVRAVQWIEVKPDTYYRIVCWAMAENVSGAAIGANLSVLGSITPSASVKDTADKWVRLELTGKTGPEQTALAVSLRLGFYDNLVTGRVYFDDAVAEETAAPAAGVKVVDFSSNRGTGIVDYQTQTKNQVESPALPVSVMLIIVLCSVGLFALTFLAARLKARPRPAAAGKTAAPARAGKRTAVPEMRRAQRKSLRINVTVKKPLRGEDFKLVELKSVNISETGLFLHSDDLSLFGVNEKLELAATYRRTRYDLGAARVVRKQEIHRGEGKPTSSGFGLEFTETSEAQRKSIRKLIQ
ncbi:MAG: PilZ domain-containing protein [Spirochaetales bacterium]|nr:PilZ domain-containing protein [Spirochaetales bacterium]